MKILTTITFLLITQEIALAQKIFFVPSIGWGYGLFTKGSIIERNNLIEKEYDFQSKISLSNFLANPQTGYFLEYRINPKHAISVGTMLGKTEHRTKILFSNPLQNVRSYFGGMYRKVGIMYTYLPKRWRIETGIFMATNSMTATKEGAILKSLSKDQLGNTVDSSNFNYGIQLKAWGIVNSIDIGYSIRNKRTKKELFVLHLLFDVGWHYVDKVKIFVLYDYNKSISSYSKSNGSQIKIFISKPILLYDLKKDKYHLFNL